jgi:hypothetical protein
VSVCVSHKLSALLTPRRGVQVAKQRQLPPDSNAQRRKARRQAERPFSGRSPAGSRANISIPVTEEPILEPFSSTVFGGRLAR